MSKIFFVVTHIANTEKGDIAGPAHSLVQFIEEKKQDYIFIKHPIYGKYSAEVITSISRNKILNRRIKFWENTPFRYLAEGLLTLLQVVKYRNNKITYIGVDPLNCFWGLIGKKLGWIKIFIFFSPDYANKRFSNNLINTIYHWIDKISAVNADFVWSVSPRIRYIRLQMGISKLKTFIVPNAPFIADIPSGHRNADCDLVMVANISKGVNYEVLLKAMLKLKNKGKIYKLKIIGAGDRLNDLKKDIEKLKLTKQIILKGRMEHEEVYKEMQKSRVGVAFYNKEEDWTYFCDPMKVRDYLACGLPVIMNDVPFIANDIEKFSLGEVLNNIDEIKLAKSIEDVLGDEIKYQTYAKNALTYAKKYDLEKILVEVFRKCNLIHIRSVNKNFKTLRNH